MSAEAERLFQLIEAMCRTAGSPKDRSWYFYAGQTSAELTELANLGILVKVLGTVKGFAWCLTDSGRGRVSDLTG